MELIVEPDVYSPSIGENGNYVDKIPPFNLIKKGLSCPCGSRKDKIYETHCIFSTHIKSKSHQKWLANINLNKANFYIENITLTKTIANQKLIIANYDHVLMNKNMTIDYLTQQLCKNDPQHNNNKTNVNLLDIDY